MTIREIANLTLEDSQASLGDLSGSLLTMLGILRSGLQGEPATFEGELVSALKWTDIYGKISADGIRRWLDDIGKLADMPIPDSVLKGYLDAADSD